MAFFWHKFFERHTWRAVVFDLKPRISWVKRISIDDERTVDNPIVALRVWGSPEFLDGTHLECTVCKEKRKPDEGSIEFWIRESSPLVIPLHKRIHMLLRQGCEYHGGKAFYACECDKSWLLTRPPSAEPVAMGPYR